MGKKRKASGKPFGDSTVRDFDPEDSKLGPINTFADVADSEDEYHIARDKILFDDAPDEQRRKQWQQEEDLLEPSDEEILGYSSEEVDEEEDLQDVAPPRTKKQKLTSDSENEDVGEEGEEGWGTSKRDYYQADAIETEADALEEEAEARRLQQKRLQALTEADYGFNERKWRMGEDTNEQAKQQAGKVVREFLPQFEIKEDATIEERSRMLKVRYPEFEPLAKEFLFLHTQHEGLALASEAAEAVVRNANKARGSSKTGPEPHSVALVKYQALTTYLGALSMYFALLTSTAKESQGKAPAMSASLLRDHPIMDSLVRYRTLWNKMEDVELPSLESLAQAGLPDTIMDLEEQPAPIAPAFEALHVQPLTKHQKRAAKATATAEAAETAARAARAENMRRTEEELVALDKTLSLSSKRPGPSQIQPDGYKSDSDSSFGDEPSLQPHEAAAKAAKKKSLRFYTSQITQKAGRRADASKDAGGDTDIPHKERHKDRMARLNAEAEKRGRRDPQATLDEYSEDERDDARATNPAANDPDNDDDDDGYYALVSAQSQQRKHAKASAAATHAQAQKQAYIPTDAPLADDAKRAIGYTIEKNKGLAPKRKKDVRNPRVKKRRKYEGKMKKLSSVRKVYKGGEGRGGYAGELTGIKRGLVRSVKL